MVQHCLIRVTPLYPADGGRVTVRACTANLREITGLGDVTWYPAVTKAPSLAMRLFDGDLSTSVSTGAAEFALALDRLREDMDWINTLVWAGAGVEIFAGAAGETWPWRRVFAGKVTAQDRTHDKLTLTAEVDTEPFDEDVLTLEYAGTTGAEGSADLKNRVKPLVIGHAKNVEPVLIDAVNNVYQFSAYGAIEELTELFERGSSFGSPVANYSTYSALVAATVANGKYATCLAAGMIRLGAPAYGVITGDIKGHKVGTSTPRYTGAIIKALATIAGIDADLLETASLDGLDAAVPRPINLVLTQQTTFRQIAAKLALACNAQSGVSFAGKLFTARIALDQPEQVVLEGRGRALPVVKKIEEKSVSTPYAKTTMGANRAWRVHTTSEIAFTAQLIDLGAFNASTTYREGNYVSLPNGAKYLYINTTPSSGHEPPNATYWALMSGQLDGVITNIVYRKNATQPAKPADSSGVPSGWVDDYGSLPAGDTPVWACFGQKQPGATNYVWENPYPMLADQRPYNTSNPDGTIKDDNVGTGAVQDNAITAGTSYYSGTAWSVTSTGTYQTISPGGVAASVAVTPAADGSQQVQIRVSMVLQRNGGSNDHATFRCMRNGVTALSGTPDIDIVDAEGMSTWIWTDTSPVAGSTNTYTIQINSDDLTSVLITAMQCQLAKR
ncbi:hypothetical protein SZ64_04360 [Erythrobacter sp. SG61-1L]|uniref:hypothetical protein n=1 Tax=Erythrobacter sp. SG61-1L TaxID=1603897 RepID=UPI0006C90E5C|nr:hypothetical protein [Erythrobacter sp. SG61-1L]KPL67404.1 hypothetical protein SZ64_04360 [Erythrobacter sp. SG61-1L]